jgi:tRNA U34 5-carboxymethylaminomethyl modifying GTPase MnmE/TrmE
MTIFFLSFAVNRSIIGLVDSTNKPPRHQSSSGQVSSHRPSINPALQMRAADIRGSIEYRELEKKNKRLQEQNENLKQELKKMRKERKKFGETHMRK